MLWWTLRQLKSKNASTRILAVEKLAVSGQASVLVHLVSALSDADFEVRTAAAQALGQLGNSSAVEPLAQLLNDKSITVREAAATSLNITGGAKDVKVLRQLVAALSDESQPVRNAAADCLEGAEAPEVKNALGQFRQREEEKRQANQKLRHEKEKAANQRRAEKLKAERDALIEAIKDIFGRIKTVNSQTLLGRTIRELADDKCASYVKRNPQDAPMVFLLSTLASLGIEVEKFLDHFPRAIESLFARYIEQSSRFAFLTLAVMEANPNCVLEASKLVGARSTYPHDGSNFETLSFIYRCFWEDAIGTRIPCPLSFEEGAVLDYVKQKWSQAHTK